MEEKQRRHIISSEDGSPTIFSENFNETYHSTSGALQESRYLFIENALLARSENHCNIHSSTIKVLEFGFGTGLNAFLTLEAVLKDELPGSMNVEYTSLEKYPLAPEEYESLNYGEKSLFTMLHEAPWTESCDGDSLFTKIDKRFTLRKIHCDFSDFIPENNYYDVVYFDPFSPDTQPESWSETIFRKVSDAMSQDAILATYSAKGIVKQALRAAGLTVHRIPGTGMKRHNVIAVKQSHPEQEKY